MVFEADFPILRKGVLQYALYEGLESFFFYLNRDDSRDKFSLVSFP